MKTPTPVASNQLIDRYVANPDFREYHDTTVRAGPDLVFAHARAFGTGEDAFFRRMIALRELPMRLSRAVRGTAVGAPAPFGIDRFTLLEACDGEVVYGLAGRFWKMDYGLEAVPDRDVFLSIDTPGSAKLALNFRVRPDGKGGTLLSTETRVVCFGRSARRSFAPYWYVIRPVSGIIRSRELAAIRRASEGR